MTPIRRLTKADLPRLKGFWTEQWGGTQMFVHGEIIHSNDVEGFVYGDWDGLATFRIRGGECEIISLDSLSPAKGIGTGLIDEVVSDARQRQCRRVLLITTNDNLHALGFYQRRGFSLVAVHRGAVNESRRLKPSIPIIGENNIPLRDEIELELLI